jgi:HK97 family phage prohead protease
MNIIHKTVQSDVMDGHECILSDPTPDRYGDVIEAKPDSWIVANFNKNPIALLNHDSSFPIGTWKNVRVENGALRGRLHLAPPGTSLRHDEVRKLVDAKILRAISVGFMPVESRPRSNLMNGGVLYSKMELTEASLVSIPANPSALMKAKALGTSEATRRMVFKQTKTLTLGQKVRAARRRVAKAKRVLANSRTDYQRQRQCACCRAPGAG